MYETKRGDTRKEVLFGINRQAKFASLLKLNAYERVLEIFRDMRGRISDKWPF